jgi:D-hydroxyproline dehydrogenase subunit alpha
MSGTQVLGPLEPGVLLADAEGVATELRYDRLILATGGRELFLPFPGWTLPNVMGAGGLQAMVKAGLPIAGKTVVVAGSGPLLLAVVAYLKGRGATIPLLAEQTPLGRLTRFGFGLWNEAGKIGQAIRLKVAMGLVPFRAGWWPTSAEGAERLESVTLTNGRKTRRIACDYLACGFGLAPNVELAAALGCVEKRGFVSVDGSQRTSVVNVFAAGELTGIGGVDLSLVEGEIAGLCAAGDEARARSLFARREKARRFARRLERTFSLRPELRRLPRADTIVCRCEDVPHAALASRTTWVDAKLQTRCGMGACQGRICGTAAGFLYGWPRTSVRPPIFPTELGHLAHVEPGTAPRA